MPRTFTIAQVRNVQIKFSANSFFKLNLSPSWPKKSKPFIPSYIHVTLCFGCLSQPSLWVLHLRSSFLSFQGDDSQSVYVWSEEQESPTSFSLQIRSSAFQPDAKSAPRGGGGGGGIVFCWKEAPKNLRRWDPGKCWELQCVCYWRLVPPEELAKRNPDATPKNSCKSPNAFQLVISFPALFGPFLRVALKNWICTWFNNAYLKSSSRFAKSFT